MTIRFMRKAEKQRSPSDLLADFNRRLEVLKRIRTESIPDAQDESVAKQQRLTEAGAAAGGPDHAIFEEQCKQPVEGGVKTTIAGKEEENAIPGFGPFTANHVVPDKEATDQSVTHSNASSNQQSSRTPSPTLKEHEMAAIGEAGTHTGLRVCAIARLPSSLSTPVQHSSRASLQERPGLDLPTEIIGAIIEQADFGDLEALNLVSKTFYSQASRRLFKTLVFHADERCFFIAPPLGIRMREDLRASRPLEFLKFVKDMHFRAPAHRNINSEATRCANVKAYMWGIRNLPLQINRLFEKLPEDSLRSFHWQLATCIPDGVMCSGSPLAERQSAIEALSLTTFMCCPGHKREPYVLSKFNRVSNFSWIGLMSISDLKSLRDFLKMNKGILKSLELDFLDWNKVESDWRSSHESGNLADNIFARQILPTGPGNANHTFPFLRDLSLSEAPFSDALSEIALAFNFSQLRSLKLKNCANTPKLLHAMVKAQTPIVLRRLELTMEDHIEANWSNSAVISFLESFQGLEDLHILINPVMPALNYWDAVPSHKSTLRNFAYHERIWQPRWDIDCIADQFTGDGIYEYDPSVFGDQHQIQLLLDYGLDCLGSCDSAALLQQRFQLFDNSLKSFSFKLLHIRRSEDELEDRYLSYFEFIMANDRMIRNAAWHSKDIEYLMDFAQWAFTWDRFPQLQILAFGDFAHDGRFPKRSLLFCRNHLPHSNLAFRMMKKGEITGSHHPFQLADREMVHFQGIHRPFEFLGATPLANLCSVGRLPTWPR